MCGPVGFESRGRAAPVPGHGPGCARFGACAAREVKSWASAAWPCSRGLTAAYVLPFCKRGFFWSPTKMLFSQNQGVSPRASRRGFYAPKTRPRFFLVANKLGFSDTCGRGHSDQLDSGA